MGIGAEGISAMFDGGSVGSVCRSVWAGFAGCTFGSGDISGRFICFAVGGFDTASLGMVSAALGFGGLTSSI